MSKFITILSIFFVLSFSAQSQTSASLYSKRPNGMYIFSQRLNDLFYNKSIALTESYGTAFGLEQTGIKKKSIIIVCNTYDPTPKEMATMQDALLKGHEVLLFASDFSDTVKQDLGITNEVALINSNYIYLNDNGVNEKKYYSKNFETTANKFTNYGSLSKAIGYNSDGSVNFIKRKIGNGTLYINLYPQVVLNSFIIEDGRNNYEYTESVLSYLDINTDQAVIYVHHRQKPPPPMNGRGNGDPNKYKNANGEQRSVWDVINKDPNLKASFWVAIAAFGLSVLFALKRVQRMIPIEKPIQNRTLDFAKTIGDLYFNVRNNADIAQKKILYWQEHVRNKYGVYTNKMDENFWEVLTKKSGASDVAIGELQREVKLAQLSDKINDKQLTQLCNNIDNFYKL